MSNRVGLSGCAPVVWLAIVSACRSSAPGMPSVAPSGSLESPVPGWVRGALSDGDKICAMGIAGRTHSSATEKARALSRERAVHNLAGVFETLVEESQIDEATAEGSQLEYARLVQVSDALVDQIDAVVEVDHWRDEAGVGPFEERGFTYARACVTASKVPLDAKLDVSKLARAATEAKLTAEAPPPWLTWVGSQKGARLCAVGFSLPALHPDATFENVVEDVRGQLTEKSKTLVMSLSEELSVCKKGARAKCETALKIITAATSEAVSRGVLVNHFWFDSKGVGPNKRRRSTYGWGCTHPVGTLAAAVEKVKETLPEVETDEESIRARAAAIFDELAEASAGSALH